MAKSFIEASTEIDDLVSKRNDLLVKISNTVASAIVGRVGDNKLNNLPNDVNNLLKDLSDAEKYQVMLHASITIAKHRAGNGSSRPEKSSSNSRSSLYDRFR